MPAVTLTQLNALSREEFVRVIGPVFEHSPWIAETTWPKRPFTNLEHLHRALCETVQSAGEENQLALIRAHPGATGEMSRCRCAGISLPTVAASGEPVVFHGLLPCHCVADIGRSPFAAVCPAFQAGRKGAHDSLRTSQERQYRFRSNCYFEDFQ
jgi:hypothetical protein